MNNASHRNPQRIILMMLACSLFLPTCNRDHSSATNQSEPLSEPLGKAPAAGMVRSERNLDDFDAIDVSSALMVDIKIGSNYSVIVEAPPHLQEYIETIRHGSTLELNFRGRNLNADARIFVTLPQLQQLELSGAAHANAQGLNSEKLSLEMSGASYLQLEGQVDHFEVHASGASTIKAQSLHAKAIEVEASGASNLSFYAKKQIHGQVSGASNIRHSGPAEDIRIRSSGASIIHRQ